MKRSIFTVVTSGFAAGCILAFSLRSDSTGKPLILALLGGTIAAIFLASLFFLTYRLLGNDEDVKPEKLASSLAWRFSMVACLPVLFLPYVFYRADRDIEAAGFVLPGAGLQTFIVAACSLLLVYSFLALRFNKLRRGPVQLCQKKPLLTVAISVGIWVAVMSTLDIMKTHFLQSDGGNTTMFVDMLRNINSESGPLYTEFFQANGSSLLGLHSSLVWYFVYPFFALWPDYKWLLILSNVVLALTAFPVFLLARRFFSSGLSLIIMAAFLLNRTVLSQPGAADLSEQRFLPLLLISTIYFWHRKRFLPFLLFSGLTLTVREDAGIMIALIGIVSLLKRRHVKWIIPPLVMGAVWFAASMLWIIPHFNPIGEATKPMVHYGALGDSPAELLRTLFLKPWVVVQTALATPQHFATIYGLLLSFGFGIPLLALPVLIAAPGVAEILLLAHPNLSHFNISVVSAALFPAFIFGLASLGRTLSSRWKVGIAAPLALLTLCSTLMLSSTWFSPQRYGPRYNYDSAMNATNLVPSDASVVMPLYLIIKSKPEQDVRGYYQIPYQLDQTGTLLLEEDYVVLDTTPVPEALESAREFQGKLALKDLLDSSSDFDRIYEGEDLELYRRR